MPDHDPTPSGDPARPDGPAASGGISRRAALGLGAAALGAASAVAAGSPSEAAPVPARPTWPVRPQGTTLARTLLHGPPGRLGYRQVVVGAGEPSLVRDDLLGGGARGTGRRRAVLALGQFTDLHIVDAQSPARVEFLDRYDDPGQPLAGQLPFQSAYRAQEMLTAHVAEAMVQAMNRIGAPVSGRPLDFTVCTGDNADNTQFNEVRLQIGLLDGGTVRADSGDYHRWEGVGGPDDPDPSYWHPDGTPPGGQPDHAHALYGFPTVPGLLDACRKPFTATGLAMPWYTVFGNHDGLVQGNIPQPQLISAIATGSVKVIGLDPSVSLTTILAELAAGDFSGLVDLLSSGPAKLVTADSRRRCLTRAQTVRQHFATTGTPVGHGYTQQNLDDDTAYYAFTSGDVRCISLDTVNPNGYADGSIDSAQLAWLTAELDANSSRHLDTNGNWVAGTGTDRLIVIFSHHTIATMTNIFGADRVSGSTVEALLLRYPNVVAWVNGHTHRNTVTPHARTSGPLVGSGFWELNTASHVDWPQQARIVEMVNNGDGTLSIFGTIIDHAAPPHWPAQPSGPLALASLSRELGMNDWQRAAETPSVDGLRGGVSDRNVELLVQAPF